MQGARNRVTRDDGRNVPVSQMTVAWCRNCDREMASGICWRDRGFSVSSVAPCPSVSDNCWLPGTTGWRVAPW